MLLLVIGEGISLRLSVAARDGLVFVYFESCHRQINVSWSRNLLAQKSDNSEFRYFMSLTF